MKRFKRLFPVLLCACLLSMAACKDNTQKELGQGTDKHLRRPANGRMPVHRHGLCGSVDL